MRYRKKPIVIEAVQYIPNMAVLPDGVQLTSTNDDLTGHVTAFIQTLEGRMVVSPGDWIIIGVAGDRYPCKPDIFEATYEAIE